MAPTGLGLPAAGAMPWKMLLAPPQMLTRSFDPNVPPRAM
jgi:hypothetical protein